MSEVFFISDLHFGHKQILEFSPMRGGTNIEEHNEWIIKQWNSVVTKNDTIWCLGDVAFSAKALTLVSRLCGNKQLVRGNHDTQSTKTYLEYFNNVYGITKRHGLWLSHAPIHPHELRGKLNIHGHVHQNSILDQNGQIDPRYINVSVEAVGGVPVSLASLQSKIQALI